MKFSVVLHNIRSTHNVGSVFRTADGAGFHHVYLVGYTPTPMDRFGRERKDIAKVALGAEQQLAWSYHESFDDVLTHLDTSSIQIIALEQSTRSIAFDAFVPDESTREIVLVIGEETKGIEDHILERCHAIIEIPMRGVKESLNVSVAFGVAAYAITKNEGENKSF